MSANVTVVRPDERGIGGPGTRVDVAPWHTVPVEEAFAVFDSRPSGLSSADAQARLAAGGRNELLDRGTRNPLALLGEQFRSVMVLILVGAAALSLALGKAIEAGAIGTIVVLFALLGFVQEHRAERAIAALRRLAGPTVRAVRDDHVIEVASAELVPGDVVLLEAGNVVPADMRLAEAAALRVQEATLTGESEPVDKATAVVGDAASALGDRTNMAYSGTQVTHGRGRGLVVATGMGTELGRIATLLQRVDTAPTPLQARLDRVGKQLALAGAAVAGIVVVLGALSGEPLSELVLTAISVAVAVIPEGLPAVVTFTLAVGAQRMLRRHALIRKLPAVETLGSVTVICSDKTGTLTQNQMTVTSIAVAGATHQLDQASTARVDLGPVATLALAAASLCNDADGRIGDAGELVGLGDPSETALLVAAHRAGIDVVGLRRRVPRVGERPFDSERKRMSTVHTALGDGAPAALAALPAHCSLAFVKGAVDGLLDAAVAVWDGDAVVPLGDELRHHLAETNATMAGEGLRVLGVAFRELPAGADIALERAECDLTMLGLVGMIDPPRPEVRDAVATCTRAGIRTVMITGDHPLTAKAVAADLGMAPGRSVITGAELDRLDDAALADAVTTTDVFARVSPEHKLRIVESLQRQGAIVAMTGDGVNDAPALKRADVGVAMGITGTDVSKEASAIVLQDDGFATIVAAVEEGRVIYDNLRRFVKFAVAGNIGKIIVMVAWPVPFLLAGHDLDRAVALLPLQLLWLNLMTDGLLGLSLGIEPAERDVMHRQPHTPGASIWAGGLGRQTAWNGGFIGLTALAVGFAYERIGRTEWQTMMFTTLAFLQVFQAIGTRSSTESLRSIGLRSNPAMLVVVPFVVGLQIAALYSPLRGLLDLEPLGAADLVLAIGIGAAFLAVLEADKAWRRVGSRGEGRNGRLHHPSAWMRWIVSSGKRLAVLLVGLAFLGAGLAMLVLPGPGLLVGIAGLAVLATEFAWAERVLDRTRARAAQSTGAITSSRGGRALFATSALTLLAGGATVTALADGHRHLGAAALVAGLCALAVLLPRTQRWLDPSSSPEPSSDTKKGSPS